MNGMKTAYAIVYSIAWPFFNLFHPCKAIGRERVPDGPVIICPNHTKLSDPLFVAYAMTLRHRPQVMAKAELLEVPILGWLLKKAGIFAVERGKSDVTAVKQAMKCLKSGDKLLMFPEGTRSKDGSLGEAKTGVAMFSVRTGTPILPVYIPAKKKWFGRTPVVFGEPYLPQVEGRQGTAEEYEEIARDLMARIAKLEEQAR